MVLSHCCRKVQTMFRREKTISIAPPLLARLSRGFSVDLSPVSRPRRLLFASSPTAWATEAHHCWSMFLAPEGEGTRLHYRMERRKAAMGGAPDSTDRSTRQARSGRHLCHHHRCVRTSPWCPA